VNARRRGGTSGGDGVMALARAEGTISGDGSDLLLRRELIEQLGQHGGIADVAGGELGGPDFQGCLVVVGQTVPRTVCWPSSVHSPSPSTLIPPRHGPEPVAAS